MTRSYDTTVAAKQTNLYDHREGDEPKSLPSLRVMSRVPAHFRKAPREQP